MCVEFLGGMGMINEEPVNRMEKWGKPLFFVFLFFFCLAVSLSETAGSFHTLRLLYLGSFHELYKGSKHIWICRLGICLCNLVECVMQRERCLTTFPNTWKLVSTIWLHSLWQLYLFLFVCLFFYLLCFSGNIGVVLEIIL